MTLMKRPVQVSTLVSAVRAALRDRRRQYAVRDLLAERQRAAEALRAERERYRVTLSSIGDAVIATDADGPGDVPQPGRRGADRVGRGRGRRAARWPTSSASSTRRPAGRSRTRPCGPCGRGVVVGLANHTVLDRPGRDRAADRRQRRPDPGRGRRPSVGAVLVFRDITERKRAEEARARLAAIVESSDDAIVSKTLDGVIRSWNAGAERIFGYTAAEAVGQPITLIIPPERLDEEPAILARLRRGERVEHFETVRVAKDGRRIDISLTVSPVRDADGPRRSARRRWPATSPTGSGPRRRSAAASGSWPTSSRTRPSACTGSDPTAPSCGSTGRSWTCSGTPGGVRRPAHRRVPRRPGRDRRHPAPPDRGRDAPGLRGPDGAARTARSGTSSSTPACCGRTAGSSTPAASPAT